MTDQALDKLMRQVLIDSLAMDEDGLEQVDFTPSNRHQQQMQLMLKNPLGWYKRKTKPVWKLALQRVAVVLLVASLGFGSVMVVSPTARAAVIRWVVEWYETHIVYRYSGDDIPGEMPLYEITALPEGYTENVGKRFVSGPVVGIHYENAAGGMINLDYVYMQDGALSFVEPDEGDVVLDVTVNGWLGQLFIPDDPKAVTLIKWIDEDANLSFELRAWCGEEEILAMAESVALVEEINQMPQYEILELPEGYAEDKTGAVIEPSYIRKRYQNTEDPNAQNIYLRYVYMQQGSAMSFMTDTCDVFDVDVNGYEGQLYLEHNQENRSTVTWILPEENLQFEVAAVGNKEELLRMAESVALVKEKKQMPQYEIAVLPEGFTENVEERIQMPEYGRVLYENNDQQWLWLRYVYIQQGAASVINTEGAEVKPVKINGHTGQLFLSENFEEQDNTVTWIDEANRIQFTVDGHFDEKTLLTIAESVSPMEKKRLMPQYEISALPNGYRETDYIVLPQNVSALYENDAGDMICFDYVYMAQGAAWQFETEGAELLDVTVNGCKGQLLVPDDPANWTTLTWIDPKQNLQFCIDAVGDKDSVIRLAESIVLKDTSKGGKQVSHVVDIISCAGKC